MSTGGYTNQLDEISSQYKYIIISDSTDIHLVSRLEVNKMCSMKQHM